MFKSNKISVVGWMVLLVLCSIPVVNVIFVVWILIRRKASSTVKNFFIAYGVFYVLAFFGMFNGVFGNVQGIFG